MTLLAVDDSGISAGWLGFLIVVLLAVTTVFLIRNMNGRLKRLPASFDDQGGDAPESEEGPTVRP
jgi:hypothetical protein